MLGLGLGFGKLSSYKFTVKKLIDDYIKRVTAAGGYLEGNECATAKVRELNSQRLLDDASWLLIPEGIKEDVVYAQKPTSGLGDLVFTRASDATRTNSAGVIERTPWNLVTWSEMFSDASWIKVGATITPNVEIAPNGTLTADLVQFTANGVLAQGTSLRTGISCTGSIYIKGTAGQTIQITAGTVDSGLITLNGSWQRIETTKVSIGNSFNVNTFAGATARNVYLWGAQLVEGTDAKPYFATTNRQDVPRLDYRNADGSLNSCPRLLLEPQRTNSIRNSTAIGAVAGTPGTLPTNWAQSGGGGLTRTIVGTGTENGLAYVDFRYVGTATQANIIIIYETNTGITASSGQTWAGSFYIKSIASSPNSFRSVIIEYTAVGTYVTDTTGIITVSSNLARVDQIRTISSATTARIVNGVQCNLTIGATYDFTIRIAAPQMELGSYATTFIPTTTATVTRLADACSLTGASSIIGQTEGTLFVQIDRRFTGQNSRIFQVNQGADINTNRIQVASTGDNSSLAVVTGGVVQAEFSAPFLLGNNKLAIAYANNNVTGYMNGLQLGTDTSATIPTCDAINIGQIGDSISKAALYTTRLSNDELQALTTL